MKVTQFRASTVEQGIVGSGLHSHLNVHGRPVYKSGDAWLRSYLTRIITEGCAIVLNVLNNLHLPLPSCNQTGHLSELTCFPVGAVEQLEV